MRQWLKHEMLVAGRKRVFASTIIWGPILLMLLLIVAIRLAIAVGFLKTN